MTLLLKKFHLLSAAAGGGGPTVSALGNGDYNLREDATCYAGVSFNTDGNEAEYTASGSVGASLGAWLDTGLSSEVWIERVVTAGSWNSLDPGTGRHQLSTTRLFRVSRAFTGTKTVTGYFKFYDAASGGNLLQQTASASYIAEYESGGGPCSLC